MTIRTPDYLWSNESGRQWIMMWRFVNRLGVRVMAKPRDGRMYLGVAVVWWESHMQSVGEHGLASGRALKLSNWPRMVENEFGVVWADYTPDWIEPMVEEVRRLRIENVAKLDFWISGGYQRGFPKK